MENAQGLNDADGGRSRSTVELCIAAEPPLLQTLKEYTEWLAGWFAVIWFIGLALYVSPFGRDDSDDRGWFARRSGVEPVIDRATGCQYLRTKDGGIAPRMDKNGRQLGCGSDA